MQILIALLLCCSVESQYGNLIRKVAESDDERARSVLVWKGTSALKELEAAAKAADKEAKARLESVIAEIKKKEPHGLGFFVGLPKMRLTVETDIQFTVTVTNKSDKTVVLYPYLSIRLLDADGKEVKRSQKIGRGGLRRADHPLEGVKFVVLKPGEKWRIQESLKRYMHDPKWITGWKNPGPGDFTLEFTYAFDKKQLAGLKDKKHPAHKALAFKHVFTQPMRIEL
ncbi:MAG: DUF4232 domain-containing protein [Planctomycetota bacterium]